jgi:hypothetical protein
MIKTIKFTIYGNQEDNEGNPVPYLRVVRGALWLPQARRYAAWKDYVRGALFLIHPNSAPNMNDFPHGDFPFTTKSSIRARMDIRIFWRNGVHGDPDNIFKGIADSLFKDDKFLDGSFESCHSSDGQGKVEVDITLNLLSE